MSYRFRRALMAGLIAAALASNAAAQRFEFASGIERTTVIELFTSEGCSSCPPADRWLSGLKDDRGLWRDVIPLAFHVDYWDYIGWTDPFADEAYSARQRQYAWEGGANSVYTPGVFRNGAEWRGWWRGEAPHAAGEKVGRLTVSADGDRLGVAFHSASGATLEAPRVNVALLGLGLSSQVTAGENSGRALEHDFVVLALESTPLEGSAGRYSAELKLPVADQDAPRHALVAWISAGKRQAPLQAVGGYLDERSSLSASNSHAPPRTK